MAKEKAQMSSSDFNLQRLSTKELSEHLRAAIQAESNVCIFGRRGTGKTHIAKQEILKSGMREVYLNLSVLERVDMGGYPNIMSADAKRKYVNFLLPAFYEPMLEGNQGVVALLDEVDKADPSLWAPLLEFIQFKSINGKVLPNLKSVVMTGNLVAEGGQRPSLPLLDRAEKYLVDADSAAWLEWAGKVGGIHPSVTAYILDNPGDLHGAVDPEDRYADPSPRGWTEASDLIFKGEEHNWSTNVINAKVAGRVGKEAGIKYSVYFEHYQQLVPLIEDIFNNKDVTKKYAALEPTKKVVACMIACARLATHLDSKKANEDVKSLASVGKFFQNVSYENTVIAVRSQITIDRMIKHGLDEHPEWSDVINKIVKKAHEA